MTDTWFCQSYIELDGHIIGCILWNGHEHANHEGFAQLAPDGRGVYRPAKSRHKFTWPNRKL